MFRDSTSCVGRLDTNPDHARQKAHHCVWSITGRVLDTLQASILDLPNLITDQPTALHIATQLSQRVGRYRLVCQIAWNCDPTFASNSDPSERTDLST